MNASIGTKIVFSCTWNENRKKLIDVTKKHSNVIFFNLDFPCVFLYVISENKENKLANRVKDTEAISR